MAAMRTITGIVYGKEYTLACDAGQEAHLQGLIAQVDGRATRLDSAIGKLPEALMLLYTALMLADELHESQKETARLKTELEQARRLASEAGSTAGLEDAVAENVIELTTRLDALAAKLAA